MCSLRWCYLLCSFKRPNFTGLCCWRSSSTGWLYKIFPWIPTCFLWKGCTGSLALLGWGKLELGIEAWQKFCSPGLPKGFRSHSSAIQGTLNTGFSFFCTGIKTTPSETFDWYRFLQNAGKTHFFSPVFTVFILNRCQGWKKLRG